MIKGLRYRKTIYGPVLQMLVTHTEIEEGIRNEMDIWQDVPTVEEGS